MKKLIPFVVAGFIGAIFALLVQARTAHAHAGTPALTTYVGGQLLTAASLNDNFSHIHNTLTGGIMDANINAAAAIVHSKLATPGLVAKSYARTTGTCNGGVAGGVCTLGQSRGVTAITGDGTNGKYRVNLSHSPATTGFSVVVTANIVGMYCGAHTFTAGAGDANGTNFIVECRTDAGGAANLDISLTVFDG